MRLAITLAALVAFVAPAAAQQTDTTFAVARDGRLEVENWNGLVAVGSWDRAEVRIRTTSRSPGRIDIDQSGSSVRVEPGRGRPGGPRVDFEITVPRGFGVDIEAFEGSIIVRDVDGDVQAETMNGGIEVQGGGRVEAESMNGRVLVVGARGRVAASSANQVVDLRDIVGDIHAEAINGAILIRNAASTHVHAETVNGRIEYSGTIRPDGRYGFETHNGTVQVAIPDGAGARIRMESYMGRIESDFPMERAPDTTRRGDPGIRQNLVVGNGGAQIDIETFSGSIVLRRGGTL